MTANSRRVAALGLACALTALAAGCSTSGENRPSASAAGLPPDCAPDRLATVREGKLTIGTDDPALEPWFSGNDPSNGAGFESAVGYRIAVALGYHPHHVVWRRLPFRTIIAAGQKPFDLALDEVTIRPERARNVDFSTPYFQVTQAVLVRRGSAFVAAGSLAALRDARLGALAGTTSYAAIGAQIEPSAAPTGFARSGLQYKFPFDTEQRAYDYFDASTFTTNPIEFVGETTVGGVEAYEFKQELGPIDMWSSIRDHFASISDGYDPTVESVLASYKREGMKAGAWGLEGDPEREVDMTRFYTNTRTIWVNPETGQIVNGTEQQFQFFAENQAEADEFFADKAAVEEEKSDPTRTAVRFNSGWNEATQERTLSGAQDTADTLNTFGRIVPIVLGILGILSLAGGIVLGSRGKSGNTGRKGARA